MQRFLFCGIFLCVVISVFLFSPQVSYADVPGCSLQLVTDSKGDASGQGNKGTFINIKASGIPNEVPPPAFCSKGNLSTEKIKIAVKRDSRKGESKIDACVDRDTLLKNGYSVGPLPGDGKYWIEADVVCTNYGAINPCGLFTDPFTPLCGSVYSTVGSIVVTTTPSQPQAPSPPCADKLTKSSPNCQRLDTGLGITFPTDPVGVIQQLFRVLLGIAGGVALFLIIYSGFKIMTSQGNAEAIQGARETITSAIVGLVFIIFSLVILQVIGVDILHIPGLKP